jgi:hypothetical protein
MYSHKMILNKPNSVIIKLVPDDIIVISGRADTLVKLKETSQNTENYQKGVDGNYLLPNYEAYRLAFAAERAVSYLLELPWNELYANRHHYAYGRIVSDVGLNVEVRTMRTDFRVPVKPYERDGLIIYGCSVSDDLEWVEVFGSITSEEAKNPKYYVEDPTFTGYRVPLEDLTPPPPPPAWLAVISQ